MESSPRVQRRRSDSGSMVADEQELLESEANGMDSSPRVQRRRSDSGSMGTNKQELFESEANGLDSSPRARRRQSDSGPMDAFVMDTLCSTLCARTYRSCSNSQGEDCGES
jgi:hypothetical protein